MSLQTLEAPVAPIARRRRSAFIRLSLLGFLAVMAFAILAVLWPRATSGDMDRLGRLPEASLYYPGSVLLREGGSDTQPFSVAGVWKQLATDASAADVLAFYRPELAALGWRTGGGSSTITGTHETQACAWHTDDLVIRVSFWRMDKFAKQHPGDQEHDTVYELRLTDHGLSDSALACSPA